MHLLYPCGRNEQNSSFQPSKGLRVQLCNIEGLLQFQCFTVICLPLAPSNVFEKCLDFCYYKNIFKLLPHWNMGFAATGICVPGLRALIFDSRINSYLQVRVVFSCWGSACFLLLPFLFSPRLQFLEICHLSSSV